MGQGLRFLHEYFLIACSLGVSCGASGAHRLDTLPEKVAIQLNDNASDDSPDDHLEPLR
jgi:glycogen phosphorylase